MWAGPGPAEPGSRGECGQHWGTAARAASESQPDGGASSGSISQADTAREPALRPRVYKHDQTPALDKNKATTGKTETGSVPAFLLPIILANNERLPASSRQ